MNATPGPPRVRTDILAPWPSQAMLGLLDRDPHTLSEGDPLPLGWHWLYFKDPLRASHIGPDGHESRGAFMPDVDLPRRMWAGGTLQSSRPVSIGAPAELTSKVNDITEKRGKGGHLVFVTVGHTLRQGGRACVQEEHVIVYREADSPLATSPTRPETAPAQATPFTWQESFLPTTVTLFQFSALTHNSHRIHYDHPYVTEEEGYPGLLVHGPLTALVLLDAAQRHSPAPVSRFRYRALAPLYVNGPITLVGRPTDSDPPGKGVVEALAPSGIVAMRGWVA